MGLIQNLLRSKQEKKMSDAFKYLYSRLKIARYENMTMQEYFLKDYRANCYYYSTYILLCMKPTDRLVRGRIHLDGDHDFVSRLLTGGEIVPNYEHGWVEFELNGEWWVYDDHYNTPIPLETWEQQRKPFEIYKKFTQTELIDYIIQKHKNKINVQRIGNKAKVSTEYIWDRDYNIPFPWVDLIVKNGEIKKVDVDLQMKQCHC